MSKSELKAITVHRPWGHAIAHLGKDIENRSWKCPLKVGSYLAIHNGKKWDDEGCDNIRNITNICDATMNPVEDPAGAIIAIAKFNGNTEYPSSSPWFFGPVGWMLTEVVAIEPVFCKGQQGLWVPSDEVLDKVRENFRKAKNEIQKTISK